MINLFNLDLGGYSLKDQYKKFNEEECEFLESTNALLTEENEREHTIEEFWDMVQAGLGVLQKLGISAYEVQEGYTKHHKKMDKRGYKPRVKESVENCNGRFEKKESLKDES